MATTATIEHAIKQINKQLPDYAQITTWLPTTEPFSQLNQQLTFNNRLRRQHILAAYQQQISQLFGA
jgi:long-subunit acyl-CoA synthetase (AMP-forming)